jgi:hypothetical protein
MGKRYNRCFLRIMRVNNWTVCIQDGPNGKNQLRRPKLSNGEVVAPEEEEEEEDWSTRKDMRRR